MSGFDIADPAFREDPYPFYALLRAASPVLELPGGRFLVSRHADCVATLRDRRCSVDQRGNPGWRSWVETQEPELQELLRRTGRFRSFLFRDPPDHTRLRGLVSRAFTPRVVAGLRNRVEQLVAGMLDEALAGVASSDGRIELVSSLAYPLPVAVICELLGVPPADRPSVTAWSRVLARSLEPEPSLEAAAMRARAEAMEAFTDYCRDLAMRRRAEPRDDLVSLLVAVEDGGDRLSEEDLLATCVLLLSAGHETTVNLIANGVLALARHPDQAAAWRQDPSLGRQAVEELLRWDAPIQLTGRLTLEPMEIGNVEVPANREVLLLVASANRDEAVFEDADQLMLHRSGAQHLSFSFGIHHCLGAPLARLEAEVALSSLLRRLPRLELAGDPVRRETLVFRGLDELPLALGST